MVIAFNDKKPFPMLYANEIDMTVTSQKDVNSTTERKVLFIHFNIDTVPYDTIRPYFINADDETSIITIVDDSGSPFTHLDFCIPIRLGEETVENDPNSHLVMVLAKLTPQDKLLREALGKNKVYTGTPLQIAIEKKVDEMSVACTQNIFNGIDVPLESGTKHFTFDTQDQLDISGLALEILMGVNLLTWHDDIQADDCEIYSPEEMKVIIRFLSLHRKYNISYFRCLRKFIRSLDTTDSNVEEVINNVKNIWYGYELPAEFKSNVLGLIETEMGGMLDIEKATMTHPDYTALNETILETQKEYAEANGIIPDPINYIVETSDININDEAESSTDEETSDEI